MGRVSAYNSPFPLLFFYPSVRVYYDFGCVERYLCRLESNKLIRLFTNENVIDVQKVSLLERPMESGFW
jgi:hypothetical protein